MIFDHLDEQTIDGAQMNLDAIYLHHHPSLWRGWGWLLFFGACAIGSVWFFFGLKTKNPSYCSNVLFFFVYLKQVF